MNNIGINVCKADENILLRAGSVLGFIAVARICKGFNHCIGMHLCDVARNLVYHLEYMPEHSRFRNRLLALFATAVAAAIGKRK